MSKNNGNHRNHVDKLVPCIRCHGVGHLGVLSSARVYEKELCPICHGAKLINQRHYEKVLDALINQAIQDTFGDIRELDGAQRIEVMRVVAEALGLDAGELIEKYVEVSEHDH